MMTSASQQFVRHDYNRSQQKKNNVWYLFLFIFKGILLVNFYYSSVILPSMAANIWIIICLVICCFITSSINGISIIAPTNTKNNNKNILLRRHMLHREPNNIIGNLSSTDIQPRNVIMPRICYSLRVFKTGILKKLWLPYNVENQS